MLVVLIYIQLYVRYSTTNQEVFLQDVLEILKRSIHNMSKDIIFFLCTTTCIVIYIQHYTLQRGGRVKLTLSVKRRFLTEKIYIYRVNIFINRHVIYRISSIHHLIGDFYLKGTYQIIFQYTMMENNIIDIRHSLPQFFIYVYIGVYVCVCVCCIIYVYIGVGVYVCVCLLHHIRIIIIINIYITLFFE